MISDFELHWLAGIIDGEGYLTTNTRNGVHKTRNGGIGHMSYITRIGVGNTDFGIIKKISSIYCKLGVKFYYGFHNPPKQRPNSMQYISINVEGYRSCKKVLEVVKDKSCSLQKTQQIKLMLDYVNYRLSLIQERRDHGRLLPKTSKENFELIDKKFVEEISRAKRLQIPPSTTKRKASTELSW